MLGLSPIPDLLAHSALRTPHSSIPLFSAHSSVPTPQCLSLTRHVSQLSSRKLTNFFATSSSFHIPAALPPLACAAVWTLSNCLLSRCISGRVTLRMGRCNTSAAPVAPAGGEGIWNVGELGEWERWDNRLETMREVVLLRTWRVLRGGLAA